MVASAASQAALRGLGQAQQLLCCVSFDLPLLCLFCCSGNQAACAWALVRLLQGGIAWLGAKWTLVLSPPSHSSFYSSSCVSEWNFSQSTFSIQFSPVCFSMAALAFLNNLTSYNFFPRFQSSVVTFFYSWQLNTYHEGLCEQSAGYHCLLLYVV